MPRSMATMPPRWPWPVHIGLAASTVLALIAANVRLLSSPLYLDLAYGSLRPADAALAGSPAFVASAAAVTTAYVAGRAPREAIAVLVDSERPILAADRGGSPAATPRPAARAVPSGAGASGDDAAANPAGQPTGPALYTESEIDHLADVRRVIRALFGLGWAAAAAIALALAADRSTGRRRTFQALASGGRLGIGITILVGAFIAGAWNALFTTFHELLFSAGTWQFPADSRLIQLFPDWFWQSAAAVLALLLLAEGFVLSRVARRAGRAA